MAASQANLDYVQKMFVAYLGRAATASAQETYAALIDADEANGKAVLFDGLYTSAEGQALYGSLSQDKIIEQMFQNMFGRDPSFTGLTYYVDGLNADPALFNILEAAAIIADSADATGTATLAAKQTAADKVTVELGSDQTKIDAYTANAAEARTSLAKVTDATSAAAYDAAAEVTAISSGNQIGTTFTLTTGADLVNGTAENDSVVGTSLTYGGTDLIVDTSSTDADTLVLTTTAALAATPTVSGIETITINQTSFGEAEAALTGIAGGAVTLNQLQLGAAATGAVTGAGNITLNFGSGIVSTTTVAQTNATNLVVNAGGASAVAGTGTTTGSVTINGGAATTTASGVATTGSVSLVGDALTSLTATGASITASTKAAASTIKITGTGTTDTANLTIGKAATIDNDTNEVETITIQAAAQVATTGSVATITDGAATTYKLTGANDVHLAAAQAANAVSLVSGKTVSSDATGAATVQLALNAGAAETEDLTKISAPITLSGTANAGDALSVANGANITASGDATADIAIAMPTATAATNVLNLTVTSGQTAGFTVTNAKTVNLAVGGTTSPGDLDTVDVGTADLVLSGSKNVELDSTSVAKTVDGSAGYTGILTATAETGKLTNITGGSGNDVITVTTADIVTVNGGAGAADSIIFGANMTTATFSNFEVGTAIDGDTQFKATQLDGSTMVILGTNGTDDKANVGDVAGSLDSATIDLSKMTPGTNFTGFEVVADAAADLGASIAQGTPLTVTTNSTPDLVTLSHMAGANSVNTGAGADTVTGGAGKDTIDAGSGDDAIVGGAENDSITAGEGSDTITPGLGTDSVILTETTAAIDTVILTTGGAIANTAVTGFNTATAVLNGDNVDINLADINALVADLKLAGNGGTAVAAAADPVITDVAVGAFDAGTAATTHIFAFAGDYATAGDLETALESGGSMVMKGNGVFAAGDAFLVLYDNGTDTHLAYVTTTAGIANDANFASGDLTVTNIVTFSGVADATDFVSNNFDII